MKKNVASESGFAHAVIDRRMTIERRRFSYAGCIPERRSGIDRRYVGSAAYHEGTMIGRPARIKWGYYH